LIAGQSDEHFAQNTLFSRRRARRRPQPQGQYRLPDWVWGLAIGVLVLVAAGGYFVIGGIGGGGGGGCNEALPDYGDVHAFTHNVDPAVREVDEELAKTLCELVIELENEYDPPPPQQRSLARMAASTTALREHLRDIAEALGFPRPGD